MIKCVKNIQVYLSEILYLEIYKTMMEYLKLFWIFIKAQFCRIFLRRLNVSFKKVYGDWYCDIKGWPEKFFLNSLMVADASRLIQFMSDGKDYVTFDVVPSKKELQKDGLIKLSLYQSSLTGGGYYSTQVGDVKLTRVWLCPVTLFVLGRYPQYIYFKKVSK